MGRRVVVLVQEEEPWFRYIWQQFVQINSLITENIVINYSEYTYNKNDFILEYGNKQMFPNSIFIPSRKKFKTDDYVWKRDDLPVYRDTISDDGKYDIFYNAFVHLSRLEEWESEIRKRYINSYSYKHPRKNKRIWKIPVVNYLFNELESLIKSKFPSVVFGGKEKPYIEFSHDVDYIKKTLQARIKQSAFHMINFFRFLLQGKFQKSILKLKKAITFAIRNTNYWCFDCWDELESRFNIRSVYYIFVKANKDFSLRKFILDPSYDITKNDKLKVKCKELISKGNKIGLHGSYFSSVSEELFRREKETLENIIGQEIKKSRQHWLNYYETKTPYILQNVGIEEDSTIAFNDISGFRAGVASIYNPYDHRNSKPFSFKEIPMVIMDSHLFDYSDDYETWNIGWFFDVLKKVKNVGISLNWHERVISPDYGWHVAYEKIIKSIKE
ncbi:MAG: hypothetical protein N2254_05775 [bacterium]|nr:hypothetical protein [bacterium]